MSESGKAETSSTHGSTVSEIRWKEVIENVPKQLTRRYLRTLHSASHDPEFRRIAATDTIVSLLLATLLDEKAPELDKLLCSAVLQNVSPYPDLCEMLSGASISQLIQCLPVILLQDPKDPTLKSILIKLLNHTAKQGSDLQEKIDILSFLTREISCDTFLLTSDEMKVIVDNLGQWLCSASIFQSRRQSFSVSKKQQQQQPITELDGVDSREIFTVLNCAQELTPDQLLNLQVFSMLKAWLQKVLNPQIDVSSRSSPCSISGDISPDLVLSIKEYSMRIIEQCTRRPLNPDDVIIQISCLSEAISLLTLVCHTDSSLVPSLLPTIRRLYSQFSQQISLDPKYAEINVVLTAVQFLLLHSSAMMHKIEDIYPFAFCELPSRCYSNILIVSEIVMLLKRNLSQLCYQTSILEKYFPALLKVLAWNPNIFLDDFVQILPSFMSQNTSVEVFHAIIDLPCLSIALMLHDLEEHPLDPESEIVSLAELKSASNLYQSPEYQPMFNFFLRSVSGIGDTFNKIHVFLKGVSSLCGHPRIVQSSKVAVPLLRCYFNTLIQYGDTSLMTSLIPVLFERVALLLAVEEYVQNIQRVLSDVIPMIFENHPDIVVYLHKEISDYLCHLKNFNEAPQFYTCVVWAVGEYTSLSYTSLCRPEVVTHYYEGLECVTYELLGLLQPEISVMKLGATLITTLSKLATRCQDLKPRVSLCLSKVHKHFVTKTMNFQTKQIILERVQELLSVLHVHVASKILSPSSDVVSSRWYRDPTSLPSTLRTISAVLQENNL